MSHTLEEHLFGRGFPVAQIRRSVQGATLVPLSGAHHSLHAWVHGHHAPFTVRDGLLHDRPYLGEQLACHLATLHAAADELDIGPKPSPSQRSALLQHPQSMAVELQRARPPRASKLRLLRLKPRKSAFERWITQVFPEVATHAERLSQMSLAPTSEASDIGIIHNDINWENLVFADDFRLLALLDFDNAVVGSRVVEVGSAAVVLMGTDPQRQESFLQAYEEAAHRPINRGDVKVAMMLRCTRSILASIAAYVGGRAEDTVVLQQWCEFMHDALRALERSP